MKSFFLVVLIAGVAGAQAPYYQGAYPVENSDSSPTVPDPSPTTPANPPPPPVVYQRVPVYRHRALAYVDPDAAALAPWPWNFDFGGGPTVIAGSNNQLTSGSNFTVGGGYNFTPRTGFVLEFSDDWLGLTDSNLRQNGAIDGNADIWSVTLNPIWRFHIAGPVGGYLIGGGGYYQREDRFIVPVQVFVPFFGFANGTAVVHQTDDAGGLDAGAGLTFNLGWGTKFFMEARYHYIFTPGSATQIIPITFGLRW